MEAKEYIEKALSGLKDFQLETVDYTIKQFFENDKTKMLIADEVGLGKTIVSRGIIAKMYEKHLQSSNKNKPFNVVYICSNQAIAKQNIEKLNIFYGEDATQVIDYSSTDDRITALAYEPKKQTGKFQFRIKAFTPATSFDQNTNVGRSDERILLYRLLVNIDNFSDKRNSLKWLLKGSKRMADDNWQKAILDANLFEAGLDQKHYYLGTYRYIRKDLYKKFVKALKQKVAIKDLKAIYNHFDIKEEKTGLFLLEKMCTERIQINNYDTKFKHFRPIINYLRIKLSECCKEYLEANLFILDEFQRYNKLIKSKHSDEPGIELARQILNKEGARVLMLSATPFKPYTNEFDHLNGEHHYKEFENVLRFLLKGESETFWQEFESNRKSFFQHLRHISSIKENFDDAKKVKENLEKVYRSCIARTERMLVSKNKDAMMKSNIQVLKISKEDINDFVQFDKIIQHLNETHKSKLAIPIEYAKSCPYPLSFLTNYQHKKKLEEHYNGDKMLQRLVNSSKENWLDFNLIQHYKPLFSTRSKVIPNAKIRLLMDETIDKDGWKYLWIPPSLPYYELKGAFENSKGYTKTLLFSSWKMVPRMVASIVSYEAERLSVGKLLQKTDRTDTYFEKKRYPFPLLTFKIVREDKSLSGMNNFMLNYPSIYLSTLYDSSCNTIDKKTLDQLRAELTTKIKFDLTNVGIFEIGHEEGDWQKWSWYAVLLLDKNHQNTKQLENWLNSKLVDDIAVDVEDAENKEDKSAKHKHFEEVKNVICKNEVPKLSKITPELFQSVVDLLVDLCLGSPANAAYRAYDKLYDDTVEKKLMEGYHTASGFISLFNKPESISVIQLNTNQKEYYKSVLEYCIDGNIQSMLDEYFYMLKDSNSVRDSKQLAETITDILSIRSTPLEIGNIKNLKNGKKDKSRIRSHFALDFGEQKISSAKANRQINIREAFNSPFRPFVLASTSIGQEGLDFHFYSKKIVHWNLPSNPIDFEQREGRIHRFKGHVIRLNVADKYKNELSDNDSNIWDNLFKKASESEKLASDFPCDLIPCWHLETEDHLKINRIVPLYPFSKDIEKYQNMLRVLAYYRFTFGQPRQDELIEILEDADDTALIDELLINLSPIYFNGILVKKILEV